MSGNLLRVHRAKIASAGIAIAASLVTCVGCEASSGEGSRRRPSLKTVAPIIEYKATVNVDCDASLAALAMAAGLDIDAQVPSTSAPCESPRGSHRAEVQFVRLTRGRGVSGRRQTVAVLSKLGLRPATLREVLAGLATRPAQLDGACVAVLGTKLKEGSRDLAPFTCQMPKLRHLGVSEDDGPWAWEDFLFAGVPPQSVEQEPSGR